MITLFIIGIVLQIILHIFSGIGNGSFYGKNNPNANKKMEKFILNLHFVQTPRWYIQFASLFCFVLYFLLSNYEYTHMIILYSIIITMSVSASASVFYQGFINWGSGLPFINKNEDKYSEFALSILNKKIVFKWFRPWYGYNRLVASLIGFLILIISIYFLFLK